MPGTKNSFLEDHFVKKVIAGAVLLAFIWAGNIYYYKQYQLAQPLFMKHYYEIAHGERLNFNLYYLVNQNDNREVKSIYIPELDYSVFTAHSYDLQSNSYYRIKQIPVEIHVDELLSPGDEIIHIEEIVVTFTDETKHKYNIGEILLGSAPPPGYLSFYSVGGSSDHTGYATLTANERVTVTGLDSYFMEDFKDILDIKIKNSPLSEDLFPFHLSKNDRITIRYSFLFSHREPDQREHSFLMLTMFLEAEDENGEPGSSPFTINYQPWSCFSDLKRLVRTWEEF